MREEPRKTEWRVPSEMPNDRRVFIVRSKKPIHWTEVEYCMNRWKEKNLTYPTPEPTTIEIDYETWQNEPQ
jgi:hypothetical protein